MEYVTDSPYFFVSNKKIKKYGYLNKDISCDILIIGGGVNGAICNHFLSKKFNVVLVEKNRLASTCTPCATALLEYQLDDFAKDLMPYLSEEEIVNCYNLGLDSIKKIDDFVKIYGNHCNFKLRPTLVYSTNKKDKKAMLEEYNFRIKNGFKCEFLTGTDTKFNFEINSGIYSPNGGAEIDPYLFTKQLIENSANQNNIYENTEIQAITKQNGKFVCTTKYGEKITCKNVIVATGFEFKLLNNKLCTRYISYTIVTKPIKKLVWHKDTLIQDYMDPYHYLRKLPNGRIIYGGDDTEIKDKIDQKLKRKKYDCLLQSLKKMFPEFANEIAIDYEFCGAFGSTKNNMGLIGKDENGIINFISCGANGIINAMYGVSLVENIILKKHDKMENIFSPLRKN